MKGNQRSFTGAVIGLALVPVFIGLLACLPVPIGNPEKSRIDPELSGMWLMNNETIVLLEPYDKRTWLLSGVEIKRIPDNCVTEQKSETPVENEEVKAEAVDIEQDDIADDRYAELVAELEADTNGCYGTDEVTLYKAWRSEFGKRPFLTWEPMGAYDEAGRSGEKIYYGFRIDKVDTDSFRLWMINIDADEFEDLEALEEFVDSDPPYDPRLERSARRELEKVLRRNADNDDIYVDDAHHFRRVLEEDVDLFSDLFEEVVSVEDY